MFFDVHSFLEMKGNKKNSAVVLSVILAVTAPHEEEESLKSSGEDVGRAGVSVLFEVIGEA